MFQYILSAFYFSVSVFETRSTLGLQFKWITALKMGGDI